MQGVCGIECISESQYIATYSHMLVIETAWSFARLNEAPDEEARNKFIEEVKKFKGAEGDVIGRCFYLVLFEGCG